MLNSLKRSFEAYKKNPFIFLWGTLVYLLLLGIFFLASIGLFLIYFMVSSLLGIPVDFSELHTLLVIGAIAFVLTYFLGGLSAGLLMTYKKALTKSKTSLAEFYEFALEKAPVMFGILLIRDLIAILILGPVIAIYLLFLENIEYMDYILYIYILFWIGVLHLLFTPAFIAGSAFGNDLFTSLRSAFNIMRLKHINYIGLFILFSIVWFLNFVPLVNLLTLFFAYPLITTSIICLMEGTTPKKEG